MQAQLSMAPCSAPHHRVTTGMALLEWMPPPMCHVHTWFQPPEAVRHCAGCVYRSMEATMWSPP
jgi:hypothetical protein